MERGREREREGERGRERGRGRVSSQFGIFHDIVICLVLS